MSIINRNGVYYMRFRTGKGNEVKKSTGLSATAANLAKAKAMHRLAKAEAIVAARQAARVGPAPAVTDMRFETAADQFLGWAEETEYRDNRSTFLRLRSSIRGAMAYFGFAPLSCITKSPAAVGAGEGWMAAWSVERYKDARLDAGVSGATLNHDLVALSQFFNWAIERGWCLQNPVTDVSKPSLANAVRINPISSSDEECYFEAARAISQDLYDLTRLMLLQGCRPMELMSLRCEEVHLHVEHPFLKITKGKTLAARRTLHLTPESYEILKRRKQENDTWIFPSHRKNGEHLVTLNTAHDTCIERAGLSARRFLIYDFRHAFATRMATEAECDLVTLKTLMGHSSLAMVLKYVHPNQESMRLAMQKYSKMNDAKIREGIKLVKKDDSNR